MDAKNTAIVEISITPPGAPGTKPWWTITWDGTSTTVRSAPGLDGDHPEDWGIPCTSPNYTDVWRDEGGTARVIEEILDGFAGAGAKARIVDVHGPPKARAELVTALQAFADEYPQCAAELRRFAMETADACADIPRTELRREVEDTRT